MSNSNQKTPVFKSSHLRLAGILLLLALAALLLWFNDSSSTQAVNALIANVRFYGEYRIGDGQWQEIIDGQHIPATKGDVTLRGNFHMLTPDGEYVDVYRGDLPVALYTNHINLTIREGENTPLVMDTENPLYGNSACGVYWSPYMLTSGAEETVEIKIQNPHRFGNENAVDELLSCTALWTNFGFEKTIMEHDESQRDIGLFFIIVALLLLGSALFSVLLHVRNNHIIWQIGAASLSAGIYMIYCGRAAPFWNESIAFNTSILGIAQMFYLYFLSSVAAGILRRSKKIGSCAITVLGAANGLFLLLPVVTDTYFYDLWILWIQVQICINAVLLFCLIRDFAAANYQERMGMISLSLPLLAFGVDVIGTAMGWWAGGLISRYIYLFLFAVALIVVLRIIPESFNAAAKARELEIEKNRALAELKESRISLMLSQIQPHFIYNTLGTIERMCLKDPQKAFELVRNFSLYLRGNFSELDSVTPILFAEELKHIEYYVNIEKVRFPDMSIEYDVETTAFVLPALSVQPLVENAIKHGLMRLETGGTVVIHAYETPTHFCVEVTDNGAGFDTNAPLDEKKHVGLRNIRGRLKEMVNGDLLIESEVGVGTKAVIMIPKEVTI